VCIFLTLIIWKIRLQSSNLIWGINFMPFPLSLSLHSSSPTFKLLSMASYGGELVLDSSSPWSGICNHLSSFSILLPLIFKKQRTPLMKKIQGLQALHGATLGVVLMQQGHLIVYFNNHFPLSIICINIHSGVACHKELMFKSIQTLKQHVYL